MTPTLDPDPRDQGFFAWLLQKILDQLPVVLVTRVLDLVDALANPTTPPIKRAILVTALLEILGLVKVARPLAIILRFTILQAAFVAGERPTTPTPPPTCPVTPSTGT